MSHACSTARRQGSVSLVTGASDHKKNVNRKSGEKPTPETHAFLSNLARYDAGAWTTIAHSSCARRRHRPTSPSPTFLNPELYAFALQLFKRRYEACFGSHEWAI